MRGAALLVGTGIALATCVNSKPVQSGLWAIDMTSGNRTRLVAIGGPDRFARDMVGEGDQAFVVTVARLHRLDLATGTLAVVSDATTGTGPELSQAEAVALDLANGRAFVYDAPGTIVEIDLGTGDRRIVADSAAAIGPPFNNATAAMCYDAAGARLIIATPSLPIGQDFDDVLLSLDPGTAGWTILSSSTMGTGVAFSFGGALAMAPDLANGRVFVAQSGTVIEVDLATGDRTLLHTGLSSRSAIAVDGTRLLQVVAGQLLAIDLATSVVTTISGVSTGTGPIAYEPRGLVADGARNRAIVGGYAY
jgi:hypothetical protein